MDRPYANLRDAETVANPTLGATLNDIANKLHMALKTADEIKDKLGIRSAEKPPGITEAMGPGLMNQAGMINSLANTMNRHLTEISEKL